MDNAFNQEKLWLLEVFFLNVLIHFSNIFSFICTNKEFINISNVILLDSCKTHICITPEDH